jgi:hypothetical protein
LEAESERLVSLFAGLAAANAAFATWFRQANSRKAASKPSWRMPPSAADIAALLRAGAQKYDDGRPWPEMGFRFSAWNGSDERPCSIHAVVGAPPDEMGPRNRFEMQIAGGEGGAVCYPQLSALVRLLAETLDPDCVDVFSMPYALALNAIGEKAYCPCGGLMTYVRDRFLKKWPMPGIVGESMAGGKAFRASSEPRPRDDDDLAAKSLALGKAMANLRNQKWWTLG